MTLALKDPDAEYNEAGTEGLWQWRKLMLNAMKLALKDSGTKWDWHWKMLTLNAMKPAMNDTGTKWD